MWEILAVVSTEEMALSSFGEAPQACAEIWICEAVFPRESVPSARPRRTVTVLLGETGGCGGAGGLSSPLYSSGGAVQESKLPGWPVREQGGVRDTGTAC